MKLAAGAETQGRDRLLVRLKKLGYDVQVTAIREPEAHRIEVLVSPLAEAFATLSDEHS